MKKIMLSFMCALLFYTAIPVSAAESECNMESEPETLEMNVEMNAAEPRAFYDLSLSDSIVNGSNRILATFVVTVRDATDYASGYYITGVKSVRIQNKAGWYNVASKGGITGIHIARDHQSVSVDFTYQASLGNGYNTYSATAYLNL